MPESLDSFFTIPPFQAAYNTERKKWVDTSRVRSEQFLDYYSDLVNQYNVQLKKKWNFPKLNNCDTDIQLSDMFPDARKVSKRVGHLICQTIKTYLNGNPYEAYKVFCKMLKNQDVASSIDDLIFPLKKLRCDYGFYDHSRYFRIRTAGETVSIKSRKHLFHVPFSLRHTIAPARYSILGYPCLYLSSSLYTCWEEMGRPDFRSIFLSRFELTTTGRERKVFGFFRTPADWKKIYNLWLGKNEPLIEWDIKNIAAFIALWPLQLACSIPVFHCNSPFKEEYIVPQLFMQWVRDLKKADGLCFRTTAVSQEKGKGIPPDLLFNLAFPARTTENEYCLELAKDFLLTEPVSFEMSLACEPLGIGQPQYDPKALAEETGSANLRSNTHVTLEQRVTIYEHTSFGKAEHYSLCDYAQKVDVNNLS